MKSNIKCKLILSILGILLIFSTVNSQNLNYWQVSKVNHLEIQDNFERLGLAFGNVWAPNGTAVCTANNDQRYVQVCSDGAEGAYITWMDQRSDIDIYAQHIDSNGAVKWVADGIAICTESGAQTLPQICSDGEGGAIIVWVDIRLGDPNRHLYAQKIDSNGNIKWDANGTLFCNAITRYLTDLRICSDENGGAIITWLDYRNVNYDVYAQRIDSNGNPVWAPNGTAICTKTYYEQHPDICSDGIGGAIITWGDTREVVTRGLDIYAQRVDPNGVVKWGDNGTAICTANEHQRNPYICSDGTGGAIITWVDLRNRDYSQTDIYCQRIDFNGTIKWAYDGVAVCTAIEYQDYHQICSDGTGGAIITWEDSRNSPQYFLYTQRIDYNGAIKWASDGIRVYAYDSDQMVPQICNDGAGGAIITWMDWRAEAGWDIYAQRFNSDGSPEWGFNAIAICTSIGEQEEPVICSDGAGGAIISWWDERHGVPPNNPTDDVYAQRIKNDLPTSNHPGIINTHIDGSEIIGWILNDDCGGGKYRVLANNSNGNFYIWVDWTPWTPNIPLNVSINRVNSGIYNYTIEYYDDQHQFGIIDTVIITIETEPSPGAIPFGNFYMFLIILSIVSLILLMKNRIYYKSNKHK